MMAEPPRWRTDVAVVVVHPTDAAVWLPDGAAPGLRFEHDGYLWFPDIEPVVQMLRERWQLDAFVLRCVDVQPDREGRHLRETFLVQPTPGTLPAHGRWQPITSLDLSAWPDDATRAAVRERTRPASPTRRP